MRLLILLLAVIVPLGSCGRNRAESPGPNSIASQDGDQQSESSNPSNSELSPRGYVDILGIHTFDQLKPTSSCLMAHYGNPGVFFEIRNGDETANLTEFRCNLQPDDAGHFKKLEAYRIWKAGEEIEVEQDLKASELIVSGLNLAPGESRVFVLALEGPLTHDGNFKFHASFEAQ